MVVITCYYSIIMRFFILIKQNFYAQRNFEGEGLDRTDTTSLTAFLGTK